MAQVLPPQVFREVVVINQHIPKALAFRRHQQRRGAVMPPQQVAVPFLQGKQAVLYILMRFGSVRFNEIKGIGSISDKTLSAILKALEADRLVNREAKSRPKRNTAPGSVPAPHSGRYVRMGGTEPVVKREFQRNAR